jgi:NAD(P)-dependent dehydrogenase (short-subunit alcohol dehydrogenase family)
MKHTLISQPVALVTGSSRGIGKAIALELAKQNYAVAVTGTNHESLADVVAEIELAGGTAKAFECDLAAYQLSPQMLVDDVVAHFGRLDVLVNNAGLAWADSFENITTDDYERIMGMNVRVPLFLTQAALPFLLASNEKAIVNISSVVGHKAYANQTLYAASKHALNGLMSALAKEYRTKGLIVHNIAPGGVATEMIKTARPDLDPASLIAPEDVARTVSFLLSLKGTAQIDEIRIRRRDNIPFE